MPDPARHARLAQLSPTDAARALLEGDFTIGDEPPLFFAIRRDERVTLDDDGIMDVFMDVLDEFGDEDGFPSDHVDPEAFLDRLAAASRP
ncbi:hypothetical protein [Rubrivirga sp.]|uniref:hypothetical protein n=1 Tax=Rubrivirga sp. TaxID=1885344 RepID=UPI003B52CB5B